ncbi:hypothetical protein ACFZDP_49685 [Streptomyces mirabilis]|uniref:hypothetical protein n=1 Tax=Streptomyces mirabilis TaxID=68239 RepID=UPI0036E6B6D4
MTSVPNRTPKLHELSTGHHSPAGTMLVIVILVVACAFAGQWELATALTSMAVAIASPAIAIHVRCP